MEFNTRLQALMSAAGVSREELARHLDVAVPVVCRWLNGASVPDINQFRSIAWFFGMPYDWFLDSGGDFPSEEEVAEKLGLSAETVANLMDLSRSESEEVLDALDGAVYALVNAVSAVREEQDFYIPPEMDDDGDFGLE